MGGMESLTGSKTPVPTPATTPAPICSGTGVFGKPEFKHPNAANGGQIAKLDSLQRSECDCEDFCRVNAADFWQFNKRNDSCRCFADQLGVDKIVLKKVKT